MLIFCSKKKNCWVFYCRWNEKNLFFFLYCGFAYVVSIDLIDLHMKKRELKRTTSIQKNKSTRNILVVCSNFGIYVYFDDGFFFVVVVFNVDLSKLNRSLHTCVYLFEIETAFNSNHLSCVCQKYREKIDPNEWMNEWNKKKRKKK